jgi:tetratricopeptide (TPR) repeat protein
MARNSILIILFSTLCFEFTHASDISSQESFISNLKNSFISTAHSVPGNKIEGIYPAYYIANNKDSAMSLYSTGVLKSNSHDYPQAIFYFTKALELDSTLVAAYLERAHAKNKLMDYKNALKDYDHALRFTLTWEESYEAYFNKGLTQALLKNMQGAMSNFNSAIKLNPEYADAYYNRSLIKGKIGDYNGELEDINKAIALNPSDSHAFNSRGIVRSMMGNYREALQDFNQAILLDKNNSNAYYNRGIVYYEQNEYLAALNDFNSVIQIQPDADAFNRRANVKLRLNNIRGAFEDYSAAMATEPNYYMAYLNRGQLKFNLKDYKSAIEDFTNAIAIKPDLSLAYYNRGLAKKELKDYEGEIADYTKAIEYKPDFDDAYYKRGLAKYYIDDKRGACDDLNTAVKQGSNPAYDYLIEHCK